MEISSIIKDLVAEAKSRIKNRILSATAIAWAITNHEHFINIVFASKISAPLVNEEIESAIFSINNLIVVPSFVILYVYYLPKADYWLKSFLFRRFEERAILNDIHERISIEKERRMLIDVQTGNAEKGELQRKIETIEFERSRLLGELERMNEKLLNEMRKNEDETKINADLKQVLTDISRESDVLAHLLGREFLSSQSDIGEYLRFVKDHTQKYIVTDLDAEIARFERELIEQSKLNSSPTSKGYQNDVQHNA